MDFLGISGLIDCALDRSLVLGYSKIGSLLRRQWWPADPAPRSMAGKRVLVTGATSGIGEATAQSFARLGATVHLLGRSKAKVRHSAAAVRRTVPAAVVVEEVCDVSDLDAVRTWTSGLADRVPALHGVVHNAATMPKERGETPQGHEVQLAAHILGPHLITERLLPLLGAAGESSVIFMSAGGMHNAPLEVGDLESRTGRYDGVRAYTRTKKMQVVLADAWAARLASDTEAADIRVESMHPGWVETAGVAESLPAVNTIVGPLLRDARDGADTAVWLVATRPESGPGHFWHDRAQRPTTFGLQRDEDSDKVAVFLQEISAMADTSAEWAPVPC
jgi:dehydrogenase/reductase SDR family protein 12